MTFETTSEPEMLEMQEVFIERVRERLAIQRGISRAALEGVENVPALIHTVVRDGAMELADGTAERFMVYAELLLPCKFSAQRRVDYPDGWWQAFRKRWFPQWWLQRHPVRVCIKTVDLKVDCGALLAECMKRPASDLRDARDLVMHDVISQGGMPTVT